MKLDLNKLKKKIDDYFENVTPEQLEKDMKDAGIDIYSKVENVGILDET